MICRAWASDGCEHVNEDGSLKPEFDEQATNAAKAEDQFWEKYATEQGGL